MSSQEVVPNIRIAARNIGGIDDTEVTISPGGTVLTGRNATNRTSFLQAIMAGLGSERASLKADTNEGAVELHIGTESYTRTLTRTDGTVRFSGDPYLENPQLADLFAFLLEDNEARRAVERGDDLREIIMRPVDTSKIDAEIKQLKAERSNLDEKIGRLDELERELPNIEAKRQSVQSELDAVYEDLEAAKAGLEEHDDDIKEFRARKEELEDTFVQLREARSELEDMEFDLETEQNSLEELTAEREELTNEIESTDDIDDQPTRIDKEIDELRGRKHALNETLTELQSIITFNEDMIDGDHPDIHEALDTNDSVTDKLLTSGRTVCWTCGSEVEQKRIENTLEQLRVLRRRKVSERNEIDDRIEELSQELDQLQGRQQERERRQQRLRQLDNEIELTRKRIADLETDIEQQKELIADLEAKTEAFENTDYEDVLEKHRKANRLELEAERLEDEMSDLTDRIEEINTQVDEREEYVERREEISDELKELRTRVKRIEEGAVESFNEHMESVLDILDYNNIDRIWIQRREHEVRDGGKTVVRSEYDLQVVRSTDTGTAYSDSVNHLSESEREVIGLVFALAGYLVHEVYEELPFMLLDSLEAIDSHRLAAVVDYFSDFTDYLIVALLPEDADALPEEYEYITSI